MGKEHVNMFRDNLPTRSRMHARSCTHHETGTEPSGSLRPSSRMNAGRFERRSVVCLKADGRMPTQARVTLQARSIAKRERRETR